MSLLFTSLMEVKLLLVKFNFKRTHFKFLIYFLSTAMQLNLTVDILYILLERKAIYALICFLNMQNLVPLQKVVQKKENLRTR